MALMLGEEHPPDLTSAAKTRMNGLQNWAVPARFVHALAEVQEAHQTLELLGEPNGQMAGLGFYAQSPLNLLTFFSDLLTLFARLVYPRPCSDTAVVTSNSGCRRTFDFAPVRHLIELCQDLR
jgi:hypothetical protein